MSERKSYFADENDFIFFGDAALSKLLIGFDCLIKDEWCGNQTVLEDDVVEVFREFRAAGYNLYLCDVPYRQEILDWLDKTFNYCFVCNDEPTRYADLCDHWTTISRLIETSLCSEGNKNYNRDIHFDGNWKEVLSIIKENDVVAQTESARNLYDDIDWNQPKVGTGLVDGDGNQVSGSSYIPVEKMNEKTTELLKKIAKPRTERAVKYIYKNFDERWYAEAIEWDVNEEIASKYGVKIEVMQESLLYRGTMLEVVVKAPYRSWKELLEICDRFCKDYGFDTRKALYVFDIYELPWPEGQKKREQEDDATDAFFDTMDDDD